MEPRTALGIQHHINDYTLLDSDHLRYRIEVVATHQDKVAADVELHPQRNDYDQSSEAILKIRLNIFWILTS